MTKILYPLALLLCTLLLAPVSSPAASMEEVRAILSNQITQIAVTTSAPLHQQWLQHLYRNSWMQPLWMTSAGPGNRAALLRDALRQADAHGISLEPAQTDRIDALWDARTAEEIATLDLLLSSAFLTYLEQTGALPTSEPAPKHHSAEHPAPPQPAIPDLFLSAFTTADFQGFLSTLLPQQPSYKHLTSALLRYRNLAANGGWKGIEPGESIHPGKESPRIPAIRERLKVEGFFSTPVTSSPRLDEDLTGAVKHFQHQHGLEPDGVIGKSTLNALNIPATEKVQRILRNLKRMRELPRDLVKRYIQVNIPSFTLSGITETQPALTMAVVVGSPEHQTPEVRSEIRTVEFNPAWNIPPKIASEEILEELRKNPHYLNAHHIRLYSDRSSSATELNPLTLNWHRVSPERMGQYRLRQEPGKWNALGFIKFSFPNPYGIYMHDTPSRSLFQRTNRAYSHGCIRLERPADLALFLLQDHKPPWTNERIRENTTSGTHRVIALPSPLPIYITYLTVTSDQDGVLAFHPDIYNRDFNPEVTQ